MNTQPSAPPGVALFLRGDGSLLIARGEHAVEMLLNPAQLLQLGMDCLATAVQLKPECLPDAMQALANTYVMPAEPAPCPTLN
jgi:hypothetical protein